ncbi:MAG TPA: S8 family serine peptidase, partial [Cellulomonas sp.]
MASGWPASGAPNDPYYGPYQADLAQVGVSDAWKTTTGSTGIRVAILDTGADLSNPDLAGLHVAGTYNTVATLPDNAANPAYHTTTVTDGAGHGTHVLGTIAAQTNNGIGVAGIAPGVSVLVVKVLGNDGSGSSTWVNDGIEWAISHGANIISMSLGAVQSPSSCAAYYPSTDDAYAAGVAVVAAAGNAGTTSYSLPASCPHVLSVASVNGSNVHSSFSQSNSEVDVAAPGESIYSTYPAALGHTYLQLSGTSMATPHVAGVAALVESARGAMTPDELTSVLEGTATDLGPAGRDDAYGYGLVRADAAVLTPTPSPTPTPTPTPALSIAAARGAPDGAAVTVEGVLSTPLGVLDAGRGGFLQDHTAGIAIYAASAADPIAAGSLIRVDGLVDDRYGERTIRLAGPPTLLAAGPTPSATESTTGAAVEPLEGLRLRVHGMVVDAPTILTDGPAVTLDDGSGPLRIIFAGTAGASVPARGSYVSVAGSLGQRDSSGTGTTGYRLFVVDPLDLIEEPSPSPSPTPTVEPSASPSASPSPTPAPSASPTPSPTPAPSPTPSPGPSATPTPTGEPAPIAVARRLAIGTTVHVRGVVTAEPGRAGLPPLGVVADESGGIFVRFPDGVAAARGALLDVVGRLADPYGQLEIRPAAEGVLLIGAAQLADPLPIGAVSLGELVEARLVTLDATLDAAIVREPGGDLVLSLLDATGAPFRARATRASGLEPKVAGRGDRLRLVGIVGQRASARGKLDGYRLWLRDAADVSRSASATPSSTPMPSARQTPGPKP